MHLQPTDRVIRASKVTQEGSTYQLVHATEAGYKMLAITGNHAGFEGTVSGETLHGPRSAVNIAELRKRLPWLNPVPVGTTTSFGFGDRIGLATPGHVASLQGTEITPILAQQSVRENSRIGRTPQAVVDDAAWGVFETGYRAPWGADADHVKVVDDLPPFTAAGYTFFTIDPSDHVDNRAQTDSPTTLQKKVERLPWDLLATDYATLRSNYCSKPIRLGKHQLNSDETMLLRGLAKYGHAIGHAVTIAAALDTQMAGRVYELEMSIDETETPTSVFEHYLIANQLLERNLPLVSLAPRFVGKFQKGVDYIGDLNIFEAELRKHVAVMHHFDCYKLSIHTGSDKFSIYPMIAEQTGGRTHVKTAGTSYLEALRVIADVDPEFFRAILGLAHDRYQHDRKSYFLDCRPEKVPIEGQLSDGELPGLLEQFDARQLLHVTFGSVLDRHSERLKQCMCMHEQAYSAGLKKHFGRHLAPFVMATTPS